jgi:hypothetical protein
MVNQRSGYCILILDQQGNMVLSVKMKEVMVEKETALIEGLRIPSKLEDYCRVNGVGRWRLRMFNG